MFEAGLPIEKAALVTGHKDWRMLQRYTNLKPEDLHQLQRAAQPSMEEFVSALICEPSTHKLGGVTRTEAREVGSAVQDDFG